MMIDDITYGFVTVAGFNETKVYGQKSPNDSRIFTRAIKSGGVKSPAICLNPDNTRPYVGNGLSVFVDVVGPKILRVLDSLQVGQEVNSLSAWP